jgi:hypothetical protein
VGTYNCYRANGEGLPRLVTVAFLARQWRRVGYLSRAVLVTSQDWRRLTLVACTPNLSQHTLATG